MQGDLIIFNRLSAIVLLCACAPVGFVQGWKSMKRLRSGTLEEESLAHWQASPLSAWQEEPVSAIFISWHDFTVFGLTVLLMVNILFPRSQVPASTFIRSLSIAGIVMVSYMSGVQLSFPYSRRAIRPVLTQIIPQGIVHGSQVISWQRFSHFQADPNTRMVRLYSYKSPGIAVQAWQPADSSLFAQIVSTLNQFLPDHPSPVISGQIYNRTMLMVFLLCLTLPFLVGGTLLYLYGVAWAPVFDTLGVMVVIVFGVRLLNLFGLA